MKTNYSLVFLFLCLLSLSLGCSGGADIASVEGAVTMDGQPLPNATVVFYNQTTRPAGARTDSNGHYVLTFTKGRKGAITGKNIVRISTISDAGEDADGNRLPASKEKVPMRYNASTELEFEVEAGKNNIANFDLTSKGKILDNSGY